MNKNVLKLMSAVALSMVAVYNVYSFRQEKAMTELELANVEALAGGETGDEFTDATDCVAVWENYSCRGKDGKLYSYAIPRSNS